jgi:hypothetical protein
MQKIILCMALLFLTACEIGDINEIEEENDSDNNTNRTTFYVSPSGDNEDDGSSDTPWKNIQFAVDQLKEDSTLIIKEGIYNERVLLSGEDDSNIILEAETGAVIDGSNLNVIGQQGLITIRDAHNIVVNNLELRNFKTAQGINMTQTPIGILINGTSHDINITNNRIHHIENLSTCGESSGCAVGANGIAVYGNSKTAIRNLNFVNNEISSCILASSEAFTINGNVDGFKVLNNYVHDNNNIGIVMIGYESDVCPDCLDDENRARNGIVKNNRSINNSTNLPLGVFNSNPWYEGNDGSAGGFYVDGGHHILLEGNYASQNDLGFEFASEHAGKATNDILMVNNYLYNNREAGLSLGGYSQNPTKAGGGESHVIMVYNNSFYKNSGWGSEITFAYRVQNASIANNIIYGEGDVADNFSEEQYGQYSDITWGKNLWWANDNSDTSGIVGESIVKDPLYVDALSGKLDLNSSSPAVNEAVEQSAVTWSGSFWEDAFTDGLIPASGSADIHGEQRIHEQLDMGADEV